MKNEKNEFSTVWPFKLDPSHSYAYWDGGFTKEECESIINIGNLTSLEDGYVKSESSSYIFDQKIRESQVSFLKPNKETEWIFRRVTDIVLNLNDRFFNYDLFGLIEGLQFTKYTGPGGKYGKHVDSGVGMYVRKLSFVLQLSDPKDYVGGDLCLYMSDEPEIITKTQGFVTVFPSFVLHEVTPLVSGTRYSLVCWISGKPFK